MPTIKVHPNLSATADERCSVSGKHSLRFFLFRNSIEMLSLEILSNEEWTAV